MLLKDYVNCLLKEGRAEQAIELLADLLGKDAAERQHAEIEDVKSVANDQLHYLVGNAYYKKGSWKEAIEHYLEACELNSESPAREKLKMAYEILEFYNKDVFGQ